MDPRLQRLSEEGNDNDIIRGIIRLKNELIYPPGIKVITQFGNIITCRLRRSDIKEVHDHPAVFSFKAPRYYFPDEEVNFISTSILTAAPDINFNLPKFTTQRKVFVGIIDYGIDFRHVNFIDKNGKSRIHKFWNQADQILNPPEGYDYGRLITNPDFNEALKQHEPGKFLKYIPTISHGTHVTDIACGNGYAGKEGIAPEAEIIGVHLGIIEKDRGDLGDSVSILEAIDFLSKTAGKNPLVMNLSVGAHGGHHTGKSLVEIGIDNFLERNRDRVLCQSCGNYRASKTHSKLRLVPGKSETVNFISKKKQVNAISGDEIEIWYHGKDRLLMELTPPGMNTVRSYIPSKTVKLSADNNIIGSIYHRLNEPNTGLNLINIFLDPKAPYGNWQIKLIGRKIVDGRTNIWIERNDRYQAVFTENEIDTGTTINTICNGYNTISVGAYDEKDNNFKLANFSSCGPTLDGRSKPDIVAPGIKIMAAYCAVKDDSIHQILGVMSGTSMASPHVTGTSALMLSAINEPISIHEFKRIFFSSQDEVQALPDDLNGVGNGKLNIRKAFESAKIYNTNVLKNN